MSNYIELSNVFPWRKCFAYIDVNPYACDALFAKEQVPVKFKAEFDRNDSPYTIIIASCSSKSWEKARKVLDALGDKMLLLGYNTYEEDCKKLWNEVKEHSMVQDGFTCK